MANEDLRTPVYNLNLSDDAAGYVVTPKGALSYPWQYCISGHLGRLGTRDDIALHQQCLQDIVDDAQNALATVDPTKYFVKYGVDVWARVRGWLDEVTAKAADPLLAKYTGVLAPADVKEFTYSTPVHHPAVDAPRSPHRLTGPPLTARS